MFSKLALFAATAATSVVFVAAIPTGSGIQNSCDNGPVQCCNQVHKADSTEADFLKGLFNVDLGPVTAQVGITCSPITVIGVAGNSCSSQSVCCNDNSFNGAIAFGCSPININL